MKKNARKTVQLSDGSYVDHDIHGMPHELEAFTRSQLLDYINLHTRIPKTDLIFMIRDEDRSREHQRILNNMAKERV